jgi:hypothetical protein
MLDQSQRKCSLREMELEVEAEGREWMRKRLEEKLQSEANRESAVFPPQPKKSQASASKGTVTKNRRRHG